MTVNSKSTSLGSGFAVAKDPKRAMRRTPLVLDDGSPHELQGVLKKPLTYCRLNPLMTYHGLLPVLWEAPNAGHQARRTAGARHERTLFAVAWMPWLGQGLA